MIDAFLRASGLRRSETLLVSIGMMISFVIVILSNSLEKYYNLFLFLRRVQFLSLGWTQMRRSRSNLNERDRIISFAAERGLKGCKLTLFTCINRSSLIAPCYASVNTTWIVELQNTAFEWRGGKKKKEKGQPAHSYRPEFCIELRHSSVDIL